LIALGATDRVVGIGRFDPEIPGRADCRASATRWA